MKYVLSNREELADLRNRNSNFKMSLRRIAIESNTVQDKRIEKQLNKHFFACGCQSGSVFVLITLISSLIIGLMYGFHGILIWWKILIYMSIAAIVGKCLGLLWSHMHLRRIYKQLNIMLPPKAHLI